MRLQLAALLAATAISGCQCKLDNTDLNNIPDAGHDKPDAGPAPPKFPLKAGDSVQFPVLGGRTNDTCPGHATTGDCQLGISAQYDIKAVDLDASTNSFKITADVAYLLAGNNLIDDAAIKPLVQEKIAPFAQVISQQSVTAASVEFVTTTSMTDQTTPAAFPFFQFNPAAPDIFESAGQAFCARFKALDADANCKFQSAGREMEVFYKDTQASGNAELHKLHIDYVSAGIIVNWDEEMIPYVDDNTTPRNDSAFPSTGQPDLAAQWFSPTITRDGVDYACSAFDGKCKSGGNHLCADPDATPSADCAF